MPTKREIAVTILPLLLLVLLLGALAPLQVSAQIRPAMVRSVDEPARVAYYGVSTLICPYGNMCTASFPAVPVGKRLRVTNISGIMTSQYNLTTAFVALHNGNPGLTTTLLVAFPIVPLNMAYFGNSLSFNNEVNFYFEAGEFPALEIGTPAGPNSFYNHSGCKFIVSGYLVDLLP